MASETVAEISRSSLADLAAATARITELQHLASYNWLERSSATISVPGSPPLWSPPYVASKLQPDFGMVYIDQNAARNPRSPLEPLFRALYTENPDFSIADVDLVTDRNNIRKLLRFVQGKASDPFQIQVEIAGGRTVLFTRFEKETTEFIQTFKGFAHNFEKAYTKPQSEGTGHHRIIRYDFGGLKCIVRHETDGYIASKSQAKPPTDSLSDALKGLSISKAKPDSVANPPGAVAVELTPAGRAVDLSATLKIKTRTVHRQLDMADVYPQLWISQTPHLVVGYHQCGIFDDIQLKDMTEAVRQWETTSQADLCKLAGLLAEIIKTVKRHSDRRVLVKYDRGEVLKIVVGEGRSALPEDLYAKWEGGEIEDKQAEGGDDSKAENAEGKIQA